MRLARESREWTRIDAEVFRTITGEDWKRSLREARAATNVAWEQIRKKILDHRMGNSAPGGVGGLPTEYTEHTEKS